MYSFNRAVNVNALACCRDLRKIWDCGSSIALGLLQYKYTSYPGVSNMDFVLPIMSGEQDGLTPKVRMKWQQRLS